MDNAHDMMEHAGRLEEASSRELDEAIKAFKNALYTALLTITTVSPILWLGNTVLKTMWDSAITTGGCAMLTEPDSWYDYLIGKATNRSDCRWAAQEAYAYIFGTAFEHSTNVMAALTLMYIGRGLYKTTIGITHIALSWLYDWRGTPRHETTESLTKIPTQLEGLPLSSWIMAEKDNLSDEVVEAIEHLRVKEWQIAEAEDYRKFPVDVLEKEDRVVDGVTMKKDSPTFETYRRLTVEISKLEVIPVQEGYLPVFKAPIVRQFIIAARELFRTQTCAYYGWNRVSWMERGKKARCDKARGRISLRNSADAQSKGRRYRGNRSDWVAIRTKHGQDG